MGAFNAEGGEGRGWENSMQGCRPLPMQISGYTTAEQHKPFNSVYLENCSLATNCNIPTDLDKPFIFVMSCIKFQLKLMKDTIGFTHFMSSCCPSSKYNTFAASEI